MNLTLPDWMVVVGAVLTAVLGVGRLTRVLVHDSFPPAMWIRMKWADLTDRGKKDPVEHPMALKNWGLLTECWWCASFWITLICLGWWVVGLHVEWMMWGWWAFWGALAVSYVATMVIVRDTPEE